MASKYIKYVEIDKVLHVRSYWKAKKDENGTLCGLNDYIGTAPTDSSSLENCGSCMTKKTIHMCTVENTLLYRPRPDRPKLEEPPAAWANCKAWKDEYGEPPEDAEASETGIHDGQPKTPKPRKSRKSKKTKKS